MLKKHIITCTILLCTSSFARSHVITTIAKDAMRAYAIWMSSIIVHELGHALVAKALWGCPVKIVIGADPGEKVGQPIFKSAPITVYSLSPLPVKGYTNIRGSHIAPYKVISCLAAGPILALLFSFPMCKLYWKEPSFTLSLWAAATMAVGNLANFIPQLDNKDDGSKILEIYNLLRGKATSGDFKLDSETKTISI